MQKIFEKVRFDGDFVMALIGPECISLEKKQLRILKFNSKLDLTALIDICAHYRLEDSRVGFILYTYPFLMF